MELDAPSGTQQKETPLIFRPDWFLPELVNRFYCYAVHCTLCHNTLCTLGPPLFTAHTYSPHCSQQWVKLRGAVPLFLLWWGEYLMQGDSLPPKKPIKITWQPWQGSSELHTTHAQQLGQSKPCKQICASLLDSVVFPFFILPFFLLSWILGEYIFVNRIIATALCNYGYTLLLQLQTAASLL